MTMNNGDTCSDLDYSEFAEVDPTGRYGRYHEILGKGASKTVYKAFDEYEGIEVAWNQVKLFDFLQSPDDLERLYCEIHLLKTLKHSNIMKFYTSWVDTDNRNINFVTEMFTSGTLRQYRLKHKRVNIRAVKHWCRQILKGLLYLHSLDPPVIHRDLKCDNVFVNGNQGEVKIGDLGLAAILRNSYADHCVGTPEFMAPEVYNEEYNELVDIYSFGMCILEMVTCEYPYSECTHPAQIYKKVLSGKKPEALYKVKDLEVRQFVEKCIANVSLRPSAYELLKDPFLQIDCYGFDIMPLECKTQTLYGNHLSNSSMSSVYANYPGFELENGGMNLFTCNEEDELFDQSVDISIKGRIEDDAVFLRLKIADSEGRTRNIYFPFDTETDTAITVANEMVSELGMTDQDATKIAEMIDDEISTLVPNWKVTPNSNESTNLCQNCASNGSIMDYISSQNLGSKNLEVLQCSKVGCAAVHGRFEEITYQVDDGSSSSEHCVIDGAPVVSSRSDSGNWAPQHEHEDGSQGSIEITESEQEQEQKQNEGDARISNNVKESNISNDDENEIRQELRWLKANYQLQLRAVRDKQLGNISRHSSLSSNSDRKELQKGRNNNPWHKSCSPDQIILRSAENFYAGALLPQSLCRAASLPVDAVQF